MSNSSLEALFLRARDLELAAGRRLWAAVAFLAVFHMSVVTPFVSSSQRREAASRELERLASVAAELAELEAQIFMPDAAVEEVMPPALEQLVDDVAGDLLRLRATRRSLRQLVASQRPSSAAAKPPTTGAADGGETAGDELAGVEPFEVENVDRILAIGEAETREEVLAALAPLVEERIVHARFSDLQQLWRSSAVPRIAASLDGVAGRVPELRSRFGEGSEAWEALALALAAQRRAVRDLMWDPPERDDWWVSSAPPATDELATTTVMDEVVGAEPPDTGAVETEAVAIALDPAVREQLRRPLALDQLQVTAAQTESDYRQVVSEVERRFEELRLEVEAGGLPDVLSGLGVARLVRVFPLVLGIVLAAALAGMTRRRRELGLLAHLLMRRGESGGLLDWYFLRPLWGTTTVLRAHAAAAFRRVSWFRIVGLACLAFAWIGFAAAQLWEVEPAERLVTVSAIGGLALLAAFVYDFTVVRSLHVLLGRPSTEPDLNATVATAAGEADEPLDGHALRR